MSRRQLDANRLRAPCVEVARLDDAEEAPLEARRHVRRQRLEAHPRMGELGGERRIGDERRDEHDARLADRLEHARQHPGAEHVAGAAAVGNRPQQTRCSLRPRHRWWVDAAIAFNARSAIAQSSGSSMFSPYGGDIL